MMRAPAYTPQLVPIHAYKERFAAPEGPNLASTIGRALVAGSAEIDPTANLRSAIQAISDDTAGRARALQDRAAMNGVVDSHGAQQGGAAVAAQPQALDALARIRADGQAALGSTGMTAAYDRAIDPALDLAANRITGHALQQADVERQAVAEQELQAAQHMAAGQWRDPAGLVQGLGAVQALALGQTGPQTSEADRADAARSALGGTVANALGQALAAGEPEFAAHIMGGWGDTLSPAAYQLAVARLGPAIQNQRLAARFAQAAGGIGAGDATSVDPVPGTLAIDAAPGAAVHPIAGGTVTASDNGSVQVLHPDGSRATYDGLGLASVAPGDIVSPMHPLGSASPVVTLASSLPSGEAADPAVLLRAAGGPGAMIGSTDTPRIWDMQAIRDRIAQNPDMTPDERSAADLFALRRMTADHAVLSANDLAAGRNAAALFAANPGGMAQAADLPVSVVGQMTPSTLAQVDGALRNAAQAVTGPAVDNPAALRLELMQRQDPGAFVQTNLGPLIGEIHPVNLAQLAAAQASIGNGQLPDAGKDSRSAVLDSLARHEFVNGTTLPDEALPAIKARAETLLRLNQTDPADRPTIDTTVADAIQSQSDRL